MFSQLLVPISPIVSPGCSVPDRQRPHPHPWYGEPTYRHPVHHSRGALSAGSPHLLQPARHAPLPDQRDPAPPSHSSSGAVRGLQPGLRGVREGLQRTLTAIHPHVSVKRGQVGGCRTQEGRSLTRLLSILNLKGLYVCKCRLSFIVLIAFGRVSQPFRTTRRIF